MPAMQREEEEESAESPKLMGVGGRKMSEWIWVSVCGRNPTVCEHAEADFDHIAPTIAGNASADHLQHKLRKRISSISFLCLTF
jgi:hypothetical protein